MFDTQSEQDFYDHCPRQGWEAQKLQPPAESGVRTPDFIVITQTGYEFVVEFTEFSPDPPLQIGEVRVRHTTLGNPIRAKLHEKKQQVRRYANDYPTVIVIAGGPEHLTHLEKLSFDSAPYGELTVGVNVPRDPRNELRFDDNLHNAGRRFFGSGHNSSISAAAALDRTPQLLRFFHNRHARIHE